jgi:hypothetical protein
VTVERAAGSDREVGCVVAREVGVLVVLTDGGLLRATYGARMLGAIARDRSRIPAPGEWVTLRRWADGPRRARAAAGHRRTPPTSAAPPLRVAARRGTGCVPCFPTWET